MNRWLTVWIGVLGCDGPAEPEGTSDIRIDGASDAEDPNSFGTRMCAAPDGTIYVLWLDDRAGRGEGLHDIWMNRSLLAEERTWLPAPIRVNHGDGAVYAPDVHCTADGVFVVWEDDREGDLHNRQIYFNRSVDQGQTFLAEDIPLDDDPDGLSMSYGPKITGSGEDLYVVWYDDRNGAYDVFVASSSTLGDGWTAPLGVESDPGGESWSANPRIAISDDARRIWVVWEDLRSGAADIYFAASTDGGVTFDNEERIDLGDADGAFDSFQPQICADGGSNVYVVWQDTRNGEGHDVLVQYSANGGGTWTGQPVRMDTDAAGFGDSISPRCLSDGDTLHVAWSERPGPTFGYSVTTREVHSGIPGDAPIRIDTGKPEGLANSGTPQLAMDLGNRVIAWDDGRGAAEQGTDPKLVDLYYNFSRDGQPFDVGRDYRVDSTPEGSVYKAELNLQVLGGAWYAAWTDGRNPTADVYFQSMAIGEEAAP